MRNPLRRSESPGDLVGIIHEVRRRWRYKLALRGAVAVLGAGVAVLLLAAFALESMRFTAVSIITLRVVIGLALVSLVGWFLIRPLMRRVTDEQVALYLEEHEPSLQAAIVSAVEATRTSGAESPHSAALVRRLVETAVEKCQSIDAGRAVERVPLRRYGGTFAAIAVVALAVFSLGPPYLRHALSALLNVSRSVEAAAPYRIEVTPGNATVPRGVDQNVTARLDGFDAQQALLMVRKAPDAPFEPMTLLRSETATDGNQYEGILFDLAGPVDYFIEAAGVRSATFTLKVVDLPYVQKLQLEYHFPAYTGLEPRKVEDGGDIAVLKGTEVRVHVVPTMAAPGGEILLHGKDTAALAPATDGLDGRFVADRDGFYRIELNAPTGEKVTASPQYTIDVLSDQAPTVSIAKPGRDTSASPIEEVFVEARAEDDYGVKDLDLVYSVNGGAEKTLRLFDGKNRLTEVTAGHTFYLEELSVQPGDFVSYYARAADNDGVAGAKRTTSDLYFLQIRPLSKEFKRAESNAGGGGGGGGGGGQVGALSQQQRQIIAATFNINRDRKTMSADKLRENSTVIALSQAKLREQVDGLVTRMNSRLIQQDPAFKKVAELLPQAITEMKSAEGKLQQASPDGAIPFEQKALQVLQKAEEEYETQVSMQRQQGGGGGGGGSQMAEDLADLFELEMDKMANQYETTQRAEQQQSDQKVDELAEKLKELARRQEQEAERLRQRAAQGQQAGGGGGAQQRALAEQVEEAARRLEQLSRDENRPDLMDSARRMREAADQMRQAAANGGQASAAQAASALSRLQDAQRKLQQAQNGRSTRDVGDAQRQAEDMAREQQQIADGVKGLEGAGAEGRVDKIQQLSDRKETLESKAAALESQLDKTAADMRKNDPDAARKVAEAARAMRDTRLRDTIRYTRSQIRAGLQGQEVNDLEQRIGSSIEDIRKRLGDAASSVGNSRGDAMGDALDKAQQVARGLQSLDERLRERSGQQGRQGQGQQGQQGQGQQGQQGQGQQGQQGQGQQGQQGRGQQGQQGQGQQGQQGQGQQGQQGQGQQGQQGQGQQGQQGQGQQGQQGQGQQGQQGQGGNGGRNNGSPSDGRNGDGDSYGAFQPGGIAGGYGDRRYNGTFTPGDVRQFRGEARQYTGQVEQLRKALQGQRVDTRDLDEILRGLRRLDDEGAYQDAGELLRLQSQVADNMKRFEYGLRRKIEGDANQVMLSGTDEVPEQFRKLVEQYYRSLSKAPEKPTDKAPDRK